MTQETKALGELEHLILLSLLRLGSNAYGVAVRRDIHEHTGRDVATGALYTVLGRLESKGLVSALLGEPTAERGGRRKKFYRLEAPGERALAASQLALRNMQSGLEGKLQALLERAR